MGTLFGTDGIRGIANDTLDNVLAYRVGQATAYQLWQQKGSQPVVAIGKDTRISSDMLEAALSAGLCAGGATVVQLGVVPTPAVAYLTVKHHADTGVVISASHNPFEYNGIKMFSGQGFKLNDELEDAIERMVLARGPIPVRMGADIGQIFNGHHTLEEYTAHLVRTVTEEIHDLRIVIDCANGAASKTARRIFNRFDCSVTYIHDRPNGTNINTNCGSTHLEDLAKRVVEGAYDVGIAFDGDADRCLVVDERGRTVDGDQIMAICAARLKEQGKLQNNGFVATIMSNLGLHKFAKAHDMNLLCSGVGDRHVLELMREKGLILGGEQSGHIIFLNHMTTGDGQLAALQFLQILSASGMTVSQLAATVPQYPQHLVNVTAPFEKAEKLALLESDGVKAAIAEAEAMLGEEGRVLVRPSGTEALIRVMAEAGTQELAEKAVALVAASVENAQKTN
ncbi:phosphoglucosamine mutase [Candidatus Avoscillospira sp. LCP25S3_F1]|uniref:phosphoglucosamine mutase n=1 Tax=Candidatus Avoscillospira sp. LCP25S3_F1 TaxID=3438825 RepID=UPI003F937028